jgi:exodeoxyribonuclease V alpha subunit
VGLRGSWITHPKYGVQLRIEGWEPYAPSTALASSFLQRCLSWVISDTVANKVAMAFTDPFVALSERPEEVLALAEPGTNEDETLRRLIRGWAEARAQRDLASYLIDLRLRPEVIRGIYAVFGSEALAVVKENPYRLVAVPGFPFAQADTLGLQLGVDRGDPRRLEGALLHTLHEAATQGHLCLPRPTIPLALENLVLSETIDPFGETLAEDVQQVLDKMTASGVVKHDPVSGIYLPRYWRFERDSARILALFIQAEKVVADVSVEEFLESYQQQNRLQLSEAQQDGVRKLIEGRVLVLTGLPGTGKTTLVRALCALF